MQDECERLAELEDENERLRSELDTLRQQKDAAELTARGAIGVGGRMLLGRPLRSSFRAWLEAKSLRDPLPVDETADVLTAIVRRVVRVGFFGVVAAVVPGVFLMIQSVLMSQQNNSIRSQIERQASDTLIVRRAQLLATIYELEDCDEPIATDVVVEINVTYPTDSESPTRSGSAPRECQPKAHPRAREEAVIAFTQIELNRNARIDLTHSNLSGLKLFRAKFIGANLTEANLRAAVLSEADLRATKLHRVDLRKADLRAAKLNAADLREANLSGANLVDTNLSGADLFRADLRGANLSGADLSEANLVEANLVGAALNEADLVGTNLFGANLVGTNLVGTNLVGTNLSEANLREADLSLADLSGARGLSQGQINSTSRGVRTRLPPSLKRPAHWSE